MTNEAGDQPRNLVPLIRWAAFAGIALLVLRRFVYATFPGFLPSNTWRLESWAAGLLISAGFELVLLLVLLGVPFGIYYFRLRTGRGGGRGLAIDCAAAAGLYLAALLML